MNCEEANRFGIADYLSVLGYRPKIQRANQCWYLSPLRVERKPSFKVDITKNVWYDHGTGDGGTLIDFGIRYHGCSVSEFLSLLSRISGSVPSLHSVVLPVPVKLHRESSGVPENGIVIVAVKTPVADNRLLQYAAVRKIESEMLNRYCREVSFSLHDKHHTALGFANNGGGWELRNEYFQASSSPKGITLLSSTGNDTVKVFEGFFDFLSFCTLLKLGKLRRKIDSMSADYLILNSLAFFKKSAALIEGRKGIHFYLDRDAAGRKCTKEALLRYPFAVSRASLYRGYKDLNEWHRQIENIPSKKSKVHRTGGK